MHFSAIDGAKSGCRVKVIKREMKKVFNIISYVHYDRDWSARGGELDYKFLLSFVTFKKLQIFKNYFIEKFWKN
jgi:hypothetical protein